MPSARLARPRRPAQRPSSPEELESDGAEWGGEHEAETEADKMSLDSPPASLSSSSEEEESCSSSECPGDNEDGRVGTGRDGDGDEDVGDVTDEEDWARIGARALRMGSAPGGRETGERERERGGGPAREALAISSISQLRQHAQITTLIQLTRPTTTIRRSQKIKTTAKLHCTVLTIWTLLLLQSL